MDYQKKNVYSVNDYRDYLEHSWGKKPEQKAAEKKYNAEYYQAHKERILAARKKVGNSIREFITGENAGKQKNEAKNELNKATTQYNKANDTYKNSVVISESTNPNNVKGKYFDKDDPNKFERDYKNSLSNLDTANKQYQKAQKDYSKTLPGMKENLSNVTSNVISAGASAINNLFKKK